jgi:tetratricopeptide (TPR) repeat protein/transglutaminase-like putative cysteine protease
MHRSQRGPLLFFALATLLLSPSSKAEVPAPPIPGQAFSVEVITTYSFTDDGRGSRTEEVRARVFSPAGVQQFGQLVFGYNFESERLHIDFVRVRKSDGSVVETSVTTAAEASLEIAKEAPIYTDYRQRNLSVAGLSPGDTVEFKSTVTIFKPLAPDQFWLRHFFKRGAELSREILIVEVPKDRAIKLKSSHPYEASEQGERRAMRWAITAAHDDSTKPDPKKTVPEQPLPDVQLSTFQSWRDVARWYDGLQRAPGTPTPELKAKAAEITRGALTDDERVRRIYNFVSRTIRYVGVSFGVGRFQAHNAGTVLHSEYGDCKDKHTLLAALLQSIGLSSKAVLIHSLADLDPDVPSPIQFDHVISLVEIGGKRVWLDSTSGAAPFGYLFAALRDKQALLVAPDFADPLIQTAEEMPTPESNSMDVDGRVTPNGDLEADMKLSLQGDLAVALRIGAHQISQADRKDFVQQMSYALGFAGTVSNVSMDNLESVDLPLLIGYHYSRKAYFTPDQQDSSIGRKTVPLGLYRSGPASSFLHEKKLRLTSGQWVQRAKLTFTSEHHPTAPIPITLTRDYGTYQSKYELKDNVLFAERTTLIKVSSLPEERLRDLDSFMSAMEQDHQQEMVVKLSAAAATPDAELGTDAESLAEAASARLLASDFTDAARLALKAVQADPKAIPAWNTLGLAYLGHGEVQKAVEAFNKVIELNPYDRSAYHSLGSALYDLGRNDEAIAAVRKHIEIVPLDLRGRASLGVMLLRLKRHEEAIPELVKAAQINDSNALRLLLYQAYTASGVASQEAAQRAKVPPEVASGPIADLLGNFIPVSEDPVRTTLEAGVSLKKLDEMFEKGSSEFITHYSASLVAFFWSEIGWAYSQMDNLDLAERYLTAAWNMTSTAAVGSRLGQVHEKGNKKELAMKTYAEAMAGDGSKDGIEDRLRKLAGKGSDVKKLLQAGRDAVAAARMVQLRGTCATSGSGELTLVFTHGPKPEDVILGKEASPQLKRCTETIKKHSFPITFPDDARQRVGREAVMYCDAKSCTISLVPPPPIPQF